MECARPVVVHEAILIDFEAHCRREEERIRFHDERGWPVEEHAPARRAER
jgi:hypothetical protein